MTDAAIQAVLIFGVLLGGACILASAALLRAAMMQGEDR